MARGFDWLNGMIYGLRAVVDESTELTTTDTIRFTGAGVSASYDEGNGWISVSIPGVDASLSWTSVATVAASATSPLVMGGSQWVSAHHVRTGATPATTKGQLRVTDGEIIAAKIDGTDEVVLKTDGSTIQIGDDFGPVIERPADLENWYVQDTEGVRLVASPVAVGVNRRLFLYGGTATTATAKGHVGLDSTGRLTVFADGSEQVVPVASDVGGGGWRVTPTAADLGVWRMDEASSNFANTGADGTLNLVPAGTIAYQDAGPLATGAFFDGNPNSYVASAATTKCQPATNLTVWAWIRLRAETAQFPIAIAKLRDPTEPGSWSGDHFEWGLLPYNTGNTGRWLAGVNIGGSLVMVDVGGSATSRGSILVGQPHLLALTHDGTTLRAYLDGALVGSTAAAGAISYGGGPVVRGGVPYAVAGGAYGTCGWLGEARVVDGVLTQAELSEIYRRHIGVWP